MSTKAAATTKANPALATPTTLTNDKASAVATALNGLVANAYALYIKTKNFHWHMNGPHFRDYHLLLDEQADQIFATIDPLAERVRKIGRRTIRSVGEIASLSSIKDSDEEFLPAEKMLQTLVDDNTTFAKAIRAAHEVADSAEDCATTSLLEIYLDETERRIWFLFESTRK